MLNQIAWQRKSSYLSDNHGLNNQVLNLSDNHGFKDLLLLGQTETLLIIIQNFSVQMICKETF